MSDEARIVDVTDEEWEFASIVGDWELIDPEEDE